MKLIKIRTISPSLLIIILIAINSFAESGSSDVGVSQPIKRILPPDLSNFPDMFIKNGVFDAVIVVGDKAPASDVVAQSNLVQFFVWYTGKPLVGSAKLSSEIGSLNQNIISVGSACHNNISLEIMDYPKQCDRWLEPGKAMISAYGYKDYVYIVIAGHSDKGARDAVNFLINYDKNELKGSNMLIDVDEPKPEIKGPAIKEEAEEEKKEMPSVMQEDKEKLVSELTERIANKSKETSRNTTSTVTNKTIEKISNEQKQAIKVEQEEGKKETTALKKILNWLVLLFK